MLPHYSIHMGAEGTVDCALELHMTRISNCKCDPDCPIHGSALKQVERKAYGIDSQGWRVLSAIKNAQRIDDHTFWILCNVVWYYLEDDPELLMPIPETRPCKPGASING